MKLHKHFDFKHATELDRSIWNVEVGEKWANNEIQHYVDSEENLYFDNGLVIKATKHGDVIRSSRINTRDKFFFKHGKIDIIAKVPSGKGTWPALWMMPQDRRYGGWPKSGEIDIMEYTGNRPNKVFFSLHTEAYNHRVKENYETMLELKDIPNQFHKYSLLWEEDKMTYFVDDEEVVSYTRGQEGKDTSHKGWPFNESFYLIMNLAIGGGLGGKVDFDCFPQKFVIQDIKVYQF